MLQFPVLFLFGKNSAARESVLLLKIIEQSVKESRIFALNLKRLHIKPMADFVQFSGYPLNWVEDKMNTEKDLFVGEFLF